jgi:cytoskeletal protein CcmA (bactofilin family)
MPTESFRNIDEDFYSTVLEEDFSFKGSIRFEDSCIIKGYIKGRIESKGEIVIGPNAVIEADIFAKGIECFGKVTGNLVIEDEAYFHSPSELDGDIKTSLLTFEKGCVLNGRVSMKAITQNDKNISARSSEKDRK